MFVFSFERILLFLVRKNASERKGLNTDIHFSIENKFNYNKE